MLGHPRQIQRFEVIELLGAGGAGVVYRARDPRLEREVAIKVLAGIPADPDALQTDATIDLRREGPVKDRGLLREARLMAQLSHPNVLPVYEVGATDNEVFLVMELIDGRDLLAWLDEPRTPQQIIEMFVQAGRGLEAAHARGIVHRDFKPANVLVGRDGRARVADFGVSRLIAPSPDRMSAHDLRGTPRYMAPELWDGAPATTSSDVYAWCSALDHALGGELDEPVAASERRRRAAGLTARQRQMLAAGLAAAPAARPSLTAVLAAFAGSRRPAARWLAAGGIAAAVVGGAAVAVVAVAKDEPGAERGEIACEREGPFAARYAELRGAIAAQPGGAAALPVLDIRRGQIDHQRRAGCAAVRAGALSAVQQRQQASCIDRVEFVLEAVMERLAAGQTGRAAPRDLAAWVAEADECAAITAPPLTEDVRPVIALYRRYVEMISPHRSGVKAEEELAAIEAEANRLGERVLAARAALSLGIQWKGLDNLAAADEALQRSYRQASEVGATSVSARALLERSAIAERRGDAAIATSLADLARELAERPTTPGRIRVLAYSELGRAEAARGRHKQAIATLRKGLDLARRLEVGVNDQRDLRFSLIDLLVVYEDGPATTELALETLEMVRAEPGGERDPNYGVALAMVAHAHRNRDLARALDYSRRASEVLAATMPAGSAMVVNQRADRAKLLIEAEELPEALGELEAVLALTEQNQALKKTRPRILGDLAQTMFELGRHAAAVRTGEQALEELTSQDGRAHPDTLKVRRWLVEVELELGKLDEAARHLEALEQIYRADPDASRTLVTLEGTLKACLALLRGQAAAAEQLARRSLASWNELKGDAEEQSRLYRTLGESLLAQRRAKVARAAFAQAAQLARAAKLRADSIAVAELGIARADAALGRPAARELARAAHAVLERYPAQILARRQAEALVGRRGRGR